MEIDVPAVVEAGGPLDVVVSVTTTALVSLPQRFEELTLARVFLQPGRSGIRGSRGRSTAR